MRTNKSNVIHQMTRLERHEQALRRLILLNKDKTDYHTERSGHKKRKVMVENMKIRPTIPFTLSEALPYTPPEYHHHRLLRILDALSTVLVRNTKS